MKNFCCFIFMKKTWPEFWLWLLHLLRLWQVRPTSETIVNHMFTQWIHSYRDLPLMVNQVKVQLPIANSFQSWRVCYVQLFLFFSFSFLPLSIFFPVSVGKCHKMGDAHKAVCEDSWISVAGGSHSSCKSRGGRKGGLHLIEL